MQPANDVQFGDPEAHRFARFLDDFFDAELEAVCIAFLARERTKLAAQDAIIRVIDIAIDDVAGAIGTGAEPELPGEISDSPKSVQVFAFKEAESGSCGNALARADLVIKIA